MSLLNLEKFTADQMRILARESEAEMKDQELKAILENIKDAASHGYFSSTFSIRFPATLTALTSLGFSIENENEFYNYKKYIIRWG